MTERFILTEQFNGLQSVPFVKDECVDVDTYYTVDGAVDLLNQLNDENEQLKKELFETRKDYILETYADNPIRRDEKLKALEKELEE